MFGAQFRSRLCGSSLLRLGGEGLGDAGGEVAARDGVAASESGWLP